MKRNASRHRLCLLNSAFAWNRPTASVCLRSFAVPPRNSFRLRSAVPQFSGCLAMTAQAKCAEVVEVAFAPAFDDGDDMIRIPKRSARQAIESP